MMDQNNAERLSYNCVIAWLQGIYLVGSPNDQSLAEDALIFLKKVKPASVLTIEEIKNLTVETDLWIQYNMSRVRTMHPVYALTYERVNDTHFIFFTTATPIDEYGTTYVLWDRRPTHKQIEEVKWKT